MQHTTNRESGIIVSKFGGSSVATAAQLRKVAAIVAADPRRRVIITSAPGKAHADDDKVTDLLYLVHELALNHQDISPVWEQIAQRYRSIAAELGIECRLNEELDTVREAIQEGASKDYVASRGEALHGHILAALLNAEYVDAADVIRLAVRNRLDPQSYELLRQSLGAGCQGATRLASGDTSSGRRYVIPGFYGSDAKGQIRVFSRGGSDVTGAIVAAALGAEVYENWTDVSGLLMADPRVVPNAMVIPEITYRELRELSYMGARVLHEEAVFPVRSHGIPIHIRNTNFPDDPGTKIVAEREAGPYLITGIAGRGGFTVIMIEKALMNTEVGFGRRVLDVFERLGISYEHMPSGIDTVSVIVSDEELGDNVDQIVEDLYGAVHPDHVEVMPGMAMVATVGMGMNRKVGTAARLFNALAQSGVNVRMIDQGSSEQNIIIGVEETDLPTAIHSIYDAFTPEDAAGLTGVAESQIPETL